MTREPSQVLVSAPYLLPVLAEFTPILEKAGVVSLMAPVVERLSASELMTYAGRVDGVVSGDDEFNADVLEAFAPRLKVISKWGTGIDSIDRVAAARLGIRVANTPGAFTEAVADSVLGYVLAFARGLPWIDRAVRAGRWEKAPARSLHECSLGVVGVGRIGRAVLQRARAFGMTLYGNDIVSIPPTFVRRSGVRMVPLGELCRRADFVSLNCDLNPTSRHLFDAARLSSMKPGAVLINTARGAVIDEAALAEALTAARIGGAALDVFEEEPLPAGSPLRAFDNVLLGSHNANSSPQAWGRVHRNTLRHLLRGLERDIPPALQERRPARALASSPSRREKR